MLKINIDTSIDNLNYIQYMEEHQKKNDTDKDESEKRKNSFDTEQTTKKDNLS